MSNKHRTLLICGGFALIAITISCSKNDNNSKVAVEEGYIALVINDSTTTYKIEEISYKVLNDTTSLEIMALRNNSTSDYVVIGMRNVVSLGEHEYALSRMFETEPDSSSAYLYYLNSNSPQPQVIDRGKLTVLKYQYNNVFQANFSYASAVNNDTISVKGEINLNFAHFDASRIPNVPISPGKLRVNIDSTQQTLNCVATYLESSNQYVLNGVYNNVAVVIEIHNIEPHFNKTYPIGSTIDSTGYIQMTYTDSTGTYFCDGKNATSGKLTIAKITYNTLQGYFEGKTYQNKNRKNIILTNGIFFARLKRIAN